MARSKTEFCNYIRNLNTSYQNNARTAAYYEISMLKDTIKHLKKFKQTKNIKYKIKELTERIKFYENNLPQMGMITQEELFDNLKNNKRVKEIVIQDDYTLRIFTNHIEFCGYNIGEYVISISFRHKNVHIWRKDGITVGGGHNHSFITEDIPCFGDRDYEVTRSLNSGGFYSIVQISLALLSTREADNNGAHITSKDFLFKLQEKWSNSKK